MDASLLDTDTLSEFLKRRNAAVTAKAKAYLQAALLWSEARQGGHPRSDADLLIGATALVHGLELATGNRRLARRPARSVMR